LCFGSRVMTTSTVSPEKSARLEWDTRIARKTVAVFKRIVDTKLDELLIALGRLSLVDNLGKQLEHMQTVFMPQIIGLSQCVSKNPPTILRKPIDNLRQFVFGLLGNIQGATSVEDWKRICDMFQDSVLTLRYILQFL
jgi:hypothetical protein